MIRSLTIVGIVCTFGELSSAQQSNAGPASETWTSILNHDTPRLVVFMSFDQLRADLLPRISDQFLPNSPDRRGGFRYLLENGAVMADANYSYLPTHTAPGHATMLTGVGPAGTGIMGNDWITSSGKPVYCTEDPEEHMVGAVARGVKRGGQSPRNLQAETVGDALRLSNNRQSKVISIATKDRAAVLLAGHNPTAAVWFDASSGNFVTSSWYAKDELPRFAQSINESRIANHWVGQTWDYLLPKSAYTRSAPEDMPGATDGRGLGKTFPKLLSEPGKPADSQYYGRLMVTPYSNDLVFNAAQVAIAEETLGGDAYPDLLCLHFASPDIIGHTYGPHSPEAHDNLLRLDRSLADFLDHLDSNVGGGLNNVLFVVTADHGGSPLPEYVQQTSRMESRRIMYDEFIDEARTALAEAFPDKDTSDTLLFWDPYIQLRRPVLLERGIDLRKARRAIADRLINMPGVAGTYTLDDMAAGSVPDTRIGKMLLNSYHPQRSGDVAIITDAFHYSSRSKTGTTHSTGHKYDTNVTLIFCGPNIQSGLHTKYVDMMDIAPTLATILGVGAPANSQGRILGEILK